MLNLCAIPYIKIIGPRQVFDRPAITCRHLPIVDESRFSVRCRYRRASVIGNFEGVAGIVKNADFGNFARKNLTGIKSSARAVLLLAKYERSAGFQVANVDGRLKRGRTVNIYF